MAPRTRSKPGTKFAAIPSESSTEAESIKTLPPSESNPPKVCILPKDASSEARILTLPNPATSEPNRFYFCPEKGLYEFTKLAAPRHSPRSWLIAPKRTTSVNYQSVEKNDAVAQNSAEETLETPAKHEDANSSLGASGYVTAHADLLIATPMDPLFMILPALAPSSAKEKQMFLSIDDHLDNMATKPYHLQQILRSTKFRATLEARLAVVCDTVDAGDEKMYRISTEKLANEMLSKAGRMVQNGLPASLEDRFVSRALEAPLMSIRRENPTASQTEVENIAPASEDSQSSLEGIAESQTSATSQTSTSTAATSFSGASQSDGESIPKPTGSIPEGVPQLLRLSTALKFISSSYLPPVLRQKLFEALEASSRTDFAPLNTYLAHLDSLKKEAHALRSLSDNISRKRAIDEDDDVSAERAEKKRKKEEEELRKKNESRGVKALKKVDTKGMKKLSSFFTAKPQAKKA